MKELLCNAIAKRNLLSFTYDGFSRVVEPHLCGQNGAGHDILTAWLVGGYSKSDPKPGWRTYLLSEMRNVRVLDDTFQCPRPGFNSRDARIARTYCRLEAPPPVSQD